ncbi:MAG TPA: endonuclease/exonuclease/phosphatase family protein [Isosphaeraceae bacterium]|nr:endonuclease/exonuclease/phosphatase family protein [Isosphaeraceae bacterium]
MESRNGDGGAAALGCPGPAEGGWPTRSNQDARSLAEGKLLVLGRPGAAPEEHRRWRRRAGMIVSGASWVYLVVVLGLWVFLTMAGDRWWLATVVLFGPRWIYAVPLVVLIPAAWSCRPRLLGLVLIAAIVVVGPVMGFRVPWPAPAEASAAAGAFSLRVLTCNTGGKSLRAGALAELIAATRPDLVAVQEGSVRSLPATTWPDGWQLQTTVASRYPIRKVEKLGPNTFGGYGFITRFDLETPGGLVHFFNLHLETVRHGLEPMLFHKRRPWTAAPELTANLAVRARESAAASAWVRQVSGPVLIAGDFNMPTDSAIYQQCWSPYTNAFSSAGLGFGYTKFTRWHGIRIDHVLAGPGWRCRRAWVGPDVGSDHRPVLADLTWVSY